MGNFSTTAFETPLGYLLIRGDENAIYEISFYDDKIEISEETTEVVELCKTQLIEYFDKKRNQFDFPMNLVGTDFQKEVWKELKEIPYGNTISYKKLAENLGNVKKIRAAASANGKNPIAIVVPCHRVIGADGSMTGYASGVWRKKWLLEHEGAIAKQANQLSLF
ncbi:methylated-DNA--[protein]-cysteine S-methyltransferase [Chondrinema litorale]|uniref:methylated-DNA--[protein]-cysteine S-methyltransferase n=1 Tax=Chondrinema litorale TaxID=2994555 RepID=UPI0025430E94|nr:methylated-DNA--[protein]-cysteine S-methyltransferase [Chondrinema litorale]UZR93849.1 methylated-DNA--[protein]-cysteine S-methyltransferase [Chondrinema litorale]